MFAPDDQTARTRYLQALLVHYGTIAIPPASREQKISLETVFQPLALRQRSFSIDEDERREHQIAAAEQQASESQQPSLDQPVVVRDGAEALQKSPVRRLLILGGPGMGKTTLLKALLQQAIAAAQVNPAAELPLFISLPDLARSGLTLTNYVPHFLAELGIEADFATNLSAALTNGQAFLCLDSLDEVLPAQRPDVIALINRQALQYGGTWVIGSRFTEYQGGQFSSSRFTEWELLPLDDLLRRQLANHLFPPLSDLFQKPLPSAEMFLQALAHDRRIAEWGNNPLLFSLAAVAYVRQGGLPASRAELYATIIDAMLGLRVADVSARRVLRDQLARLALDLYQTKGRNFIAQDLRELLTAYGYGHSASSLYDHLALILDSGVFDVVAHQTYGFKHQMFQEYLAAVALAGQLLDSDERVVRTAWDFIRRKCTYSRWREILRLLVGVLVQEHDLEGSGLAANWLHHLASVHTGAEGDPGYLCLILALSSLQEFSVGDYSPQMAQAIRELLVLWAEAFSGALVKSAQGYCYYGRDDDPADATRRFERLEQLVEDIQRLDLSLVLPALSVLEQAFEREKTRDVVENVEKKFAEFLHEFALSIPARVLALAFPEPNTVDLSTIVTAKKLAVAMDVVALADLLENPHESWQARAGAAHLLARAAAPLAYFALCRVLADPACFYRVRVVVAEALGWRGGTAAATALMQAAHDLDERIRLAAVKAMGDLGLDMPVQALLAALSDTETQVHMAAVEALGRLDERLSLQPLLQALQDENISVRMGVFNTLTKIQHVSSYMPIERVIEMLRSPEYEVRCAAVLLLGNFADVSSLPPLLAALHDDTQSPSGYGENIANLAISSLGKLSAKMPDLSKWVTAEHLEQAFSNEATNDYRLMDLLHFLHIRLPPQIPLAELAKNSYIPAFEQKLQHLSMQGANVPVSYLLDVLFTSVSDIQKNAARALLSLYEHVPAEPIIAWLQRVDLGPEAHSFAARQLLSEAYTYLSELLVRQGKEVDVEVLLSILENANIRGEVEESFARICGVLQTKAPIARLFGMLCDAGWADQCMRILSNLYELLTPELIRAGAAHRYEDEVAAIEVLEAMQEEAPVDLLMNILKDDTREKWVRVNALYTLHGLGAAVPLEYFVLGQDWCFYGVDDYMVESMTRLGEQAPIPELVNLLGYSNNWVRASAMRSLRNLAEHVPVELMLTALESTHAHVREEAASALGAFGERAPVEKLLAMVRDKRESLHVRRAALETLTDLHVHLPVELLLRLVQLGDHRLRSAGFSAFEVLGSETPLAVILQLLNDVSLRNEAIGVLGSMAENAPIDLLFSFFDSDDEEVAWAHYPAVHALAKLGKHAPVEEMIARVYDKDGEMRQDLINAFGEMGEYAPIDVILKALDSDDHEIRHGADMALFKLVENAPARLVAEAGDDLRPVVRKRVLGALAKLGKDAPIEIALAALEDKETQGEALSALLKLGVDVSARMSKETFLHMLHVEDEGRALDWQELELLEQFGEPIPVELLLAEIEDDLGEIAKKLYKRYPAVFREVIMPQAEAMLRGEPAGGVFASLVQSRSATMIGQIGRATPDVLNMVVDLLDVPSEKTRLEAVRALGAIHRNIPDRAIRRLLELRRDPRSPDLRSAADLALAEILSYESGMEEEA